MSSKKHEINTAVALAVVALVWTGLLLGVSFLATPVKFLAPSLSLPVALDVGRQTFRWFSRVDIVLAIATLIAAFAYDKDRLRRMSRNAALPLALPVSVALLAAIAFQVLWLLPRLDARVEIILGGAMPPPSRLHDVYVAVEALKLAALVGLGWHAMGVLSRASSGMLEERR